MLSINWKKKDSTPLPDPGYSPVILPKKHTVKDNPIKMVINIERCIVFVGDDNDHSQPIQYIPLFRSFILNFCAHKVDTCLRQQVLDSPINCQNQPIIYAEIPHNIIFCLSIILNSVNKTY